MIVTRNAFLLGALVWVLSSAPTLLTMNGGVALPLGGSNALAAEFNPDPGDEKAPDQPQPEAPGEPHLSRITFHRCPDADRCLLTLPEYRDKLGDPVIVRLDGIRTPHLRGKCEQERILAQDARDLLHTVLSDAAQIELYGQYLVGFVLVARVMADGQDLSELLLAQGFAVPRKSGPTDWCAL
ncbi:MAG: thermonuclease family protein [Nitrospiraceae bacterium]